MGTVDAVILAFCVLMAAVGFRQGLLVSTLSVVGFVAGALAGTRLATLVLPGGSSSDYAPVAGLFGAVVGGGMLATGLEGLGAGLRRAMRRVPGVAAVDGLLGAGLSAALGLGIAWVAGAVALQTPGARDLRRDVQRSTILRRLDDVLPPSGPLLNALARFDPFPALDGPAADVPAPRARVAREPGVRRAAASVVRVTGSACGLGLEGSGWVAGDGLVVTNAHVIAGEDDTQVQVRGTGPRFDATPVHVDARNDVVVLRVSGLQGVPALALAPAQASGSDGAVLGFPRDGPYDVRAARLAATRTVISDDAYGRGPVRRSITSFRGRVRPGNSGGPVVSAGGRVLATVFAAARGRGPHTGYGVPDRVVAAALAGRLAPASSGPCAP